MKLKEQGEEEVILMDEDFVVALEYGLPPQEDLAWHRQVGHATNRGREHKRRDLVPTLRPKSTEAVVEITELDQ